MPDVDGLEVLSRLKASAPDTAVIVMTAHGSVRSAVEAMQRGAYDYLTKPFDNDVVRALLEHGALVDLPNASGVTPFMSAAGVGTRTGGGRTVAGVAPNPSSPSSRAFTHSCPARSPQWVKTETLSPAANSELEHSSRAYHGNR